jgi:hypothetical protein
MIAFRSFKWPALSAGRYRLTARQTIRGAGGFTDTLGDVIEVEATGPRFTLPPERIHSRFPAPGSRGDFGEVLPQIALNSPTLPWLREPAARARGAAPARTCTPWMALLVFHDSDPAPPVMTGPLAELIGSRDYPGWARREASEDPTDLCQWVDVDGRLFAAIAPRAADVRWLAHVRRQEDDELAVVLANRFPAPEGVTTCCLVSIEDAGDVLPPSPMLSKIVRLPVLDSWTFSRAGATEDFERLIGALRPRPLRLAERPVELEHGYTLLGHTMRQGATSASWYRGPLKPSAETVSDRVAVGNDSADELLRYDPRTGMFDVSLAAAWQLGRLLALADAELAVAIAGWKASGQRLHAQAAERALLGPAADLESALVTPAIERLVQE